MISLLLVCLEVVKEERKKFFNKLRKQKIKGFYLHVVINQIKQVRSNKLQYPKAFQLIKKGDNNGIFQPHNVALRFLCEVVSFCGLFFVFESHCKKRDST